MTQIGYMEGRSETQIRKKQARMGGRNMVACLGGLFINIH